MVQYRVFTMVKQTSSTKKNSSITGMICQGQFAQSFRTEGILALKAAYADCFPKKSTCFAEE
jgi:hypothetical protein